MKQTGALRNFTVLLGIAFASTVARAAEPRTTRNVLDVAGNPSRTVLDYNQ
jgi:hypothetical protein